MANPHDQKRSAAPLTIGRVAKAAGVNVETVRYYQRIGLIDQPAKPACGHRHYPDAVVERIRFIKRAQELGFSLAEIRDLLSLGEMECDEVRAIAERKSEQIRKRIDDLRAMEHELARLIEACKKSISARERCAIIAALTSTNIPPDR